MDDLAESPSGRKRQKAIIPISLDTIWFLVLISTVLLSSCRPTQRPFINIKPGISAPDFNLKAARGDTYDLASLRGETILLSFINTQAKAAASESDPSRAQIVFLKSMQEQYTAKGLNVWIIDAARQETGNQPSLDDLVNFTYNWQLDTIPVLIDDHAEVAQAFGVSSVPTTFLIDTNGVVQQRWDGMASSPQLALAIEALVGAPAYRSTESFVTYQPSNCPSESLPQAKFAGVGLARPLSNEIWVIDNRKSWRVGNRFPLQWIVIDSHNKSETESLHLRVMSSSPWNRRISNEPSPESDARPANGLSNQDQGPSGSPLDGLV